MDLVLILVIVEKCKLNPHVCVIQSSNLSAIYHLLIECIVVELYKGANKRLQLS